MTPQSQSWMGSSAGSPRSGEKADPNLIPVYTDIQVRAAPGGQIHRQRVHASLQSLSVQSALSEPQLTSSAGGAYGGRTFPLRLLAASANVTTLVLEDTT